MFFSHTQCTVVLLHGRSQQLELLSLEHQKALPAWQQHCRSHSGLGNGQHEGLGEKGDFGREKSPLKTCQKSFVTLMDN